MNTTQEDVVNNFILDYLPPSSNNILISKPKCITQLKRRIIRVDAIQKHCMILNHQLSDKTKELDETKKKLESTQEEYKLTSLEYKETLENASKYEKENQKLKATVETLEREHLHTLTQLEARQSHIVQLQELVNQKDRKIELLEKYEPKNIERMIEERIGAELKEKDREKLLWKKRYERLRKKVKDNENIEKLNKELLEKLEKDEVGSDSHSLDGHSDNEDINSVEFMSQIIEQELSKSSKHMMKTSSITLKDGIEMDNDYSNEIVSIDTGCGSSLASSDNEKWLNSPDYVFSPIQADNVETYRGRKLVTVGTSPILLKTNIDIATSPVLSKPNVDIATSPILSKTNLDIATSPILFEIVRDIEISHIETKKMTDTATSPILNLEYETNTYKSMITMDKPTVKQFIMCSESISILTNNTTEADTSSVNVLEKDEAYKSDNTRSKKESDENLCSINNIIEMDVQKVSSIIEETSVNTLNILENKTDSDMQKCDEDTESAIKRVKALEDITYPDSDQDIQEAMSISRETDTKDISNTDIKENCNIGEISHSPVKNVGVMSSLTENKEEYETLKVTDNIAGIEPINQVYEKELNSNNCNEVYVHNDMDNEIQMILKSMRFRRKLITPLPRTPVRTFGQSASKHSSDLTAEELTHTMCQEAAIARDLAGAAKEEAASAREHAAKLREDHIKLMADFSKLQKDMMTIKNMFNSQISLRNDTKLHVNKDFVDHGNDFRFGHWQDRPPVLDNDSNKFFDQSTKLDNNSNLNCCDLSLIINNNLMKVKSLSSGQNDSEFGDSNLQDRPIINSEIESSQLSEKSVKTVLDSNINFDQVKDFSEIPKTYSILNDLEISLPTSKSGEFNCAQDSFKTLDLNESDSLSSQPENKIKIISDKTVNLTELEHLKSKQDWEKFIQNSKQDVGPQYNIQQFRTSLIEDESFNSGEENEKSPIQDTKKKPKKVRKLTNLGKYRRKCEKPVYKIKRESPPLVRTCRKKTKPLLVCMKKKRISDTSTTLNDKDIYANAVKIMAELNAKTPKCSVQTAADMETQQNGMQKDLNTDCNTSETSMKIIHSPMSTPVISQESDNNVHNISENICSISTSLNSSPPKSTTVSVAKSNIVTRSRKIPDRLNNTPESAINSGTENSEKSLENILHPPFENNNDKYQNINEIPLAMTPRKRKLSDCPDIPSKRVLRNTQRINTEENKIESDTIKKDPIISTIRNPKESILCSMIQKYGRNSTKYKKSKVDEEDSKTVCENIEKFMSETKNLTCKQKREDLVNDLRKFNYKNFIGGLMQYLNNPERKCDLFSKMSSVPAQIQITKSEAVLMYVIKQLGKCWHPLDLVGTILSSIEYILFRLNQTPCFDVVESMSHFYAVLCRINDDRDRLITFMLDSMYCILFKSVVLIKQCLEAWPNIIPLAHMSKAKTPLMTCFVYLLHFFKCDDRFNRVQDIRFILQRKYFYDIKDWNEIKIVGLLKSSIKELRDNEHDKKMLRIALIVFGKRHGPKWTNNNIIRKIFQPCIENDDTPNYIKVFCIALMGPLFKPYPLEMKVHCDIALDQLVVILNTTKYEEIAEAALSSIVLMGRHNYERVTQVLFSHKMGSISPELEGLIRDHIRLRNISTWLRTLPKISYDCNKARNKLLY